MRARRESSATGCASFLILMGCSPTSSRRSSRRRGSAALVHEPPLYTIPAWDADGVAKKREQAPANGRMSWDGRMWDRQGRQFEMTRELDRAEAHALLSDEQVQVAIYSSTSALEWVEAKDRRRTWSERILPRLHDTPDWQPPPGEPGTLPFVPELWSEVKGIGKTLVFNDRD